jgi:hypothetical protein
MPLHKDLTGLQFNNLTVTEFSHKDHRNNALWLCQCVCGNMTHVSTTDLRRGKTKSCGCLKRHTSNTIPAPHGLYKTPEYTVWGAMHTRCRNPNQPHYKHYGGRGITVDPRWDDFTNFLADMGPRPSLQHSIERIDNDKGYGPDNCKWATQTEQCRNTSRNHWIDTPRGRFVLTEAAAEYGLRKDTLRARLKAGWPVEKALTTPVRKRA